ncbi:MAG: hypothetical protein R3E68_12250 [Burkholderiaceae bacterium]
MNDTTSMAARLAAVQARRGYLLPHHGLMALLSPGLLAGYDAAYAAIALERKVLDDLARETVWLAVLIATDEAIATHHIRTWMPVAIWRVLRRSTGCPQPPVARTRSSSWPDTGWTTCQVRSVGDLPRSDHRSRRSAAGLAGLAGGLRRACRACRLARVAVGICAAYDAGVPGARTGRGLSRSWMRLAVTLVRRGGPGCGWT